MSGILGVTMHFEAHHNVISELEARILTIRESL